MLRLQSRVTGSYDVREAEKRYNESTGIMQEEYDVPKISFAFVHRSDEALYQNEAEETIKSEVTVPISGHVESRSFEVLPVFGIIKCGSDPSLDDGLYKVPRSLVTKRCRLSQSLEDLDLNVDKIEQIEHVSCSQVIINANTIERNEEPEMKDMDYCKTRSRLPLKIRRPTFLKKPKNAVETWTNFKSKFNNLMGDSEEKTGNNLVNFEEVYKSSKNKLKNLKLFSKNKKAADTIDDTNRIVKNDAFFDRVRFEGEDSKDSIKDDKMDENDDKKDFDFTTIKSAFRRSRYWGEGQNGFEDLRRYVKQGGDFCKELSTIIQERAEAETHYAKSLSKLSAKLSRACRDGVGGMNEAFKAIAIELEAKAEIHRTLGTTLSEETARPLRTLTETQHRTRKQCENAVDKSFRALCDWRNAEAKGKKQSHGCARDNEKLQDAAVLDGSRNGKLTLSRSTSLIQLNNGKNNNTEKEHAKMECKKKKAEDAVKKADIEYYTLCVRAERARLEWESAVLRGVNTFQSLEDERLNHLKSLLNSYFQFESELGPRLIEATEKLRAPISEAEPSKDLSTFVNLRQSSQQVSEQLLPDFYCEHITLAMNRERRKQALIKLLQLIRQDIERERKSKCGLENLSKAMKQTPNFGAEDSKQNVGEKLYHMKSMLTYLEGARYKVHNALSEIDNHPKAGHPLASHITITRDKSGLQQSVLKVPQWLRDDFYDFDKSPLSEKSIKSDNSDPHNNDLPDWNDRGAADGNSNQPDSDFDKFSDEFSSECSSSAGNRPDDVPVQPVARCRALYAYTPNLNDELMLKPGDVVSVYRQQDDGWWLGECNGNVGIFPATYVEVL